MNNLFDIASDIISAMLAIALNKLFITITVDIGISNPADKFKKTFNNLQQLAIANLYFRDQAKQCRRITVLCIATFLCMIVVKYRLHLLPAASNIALILLALLVLPILTYARLLVIAYRILKGYFGNNRSEITSLISFIAEKSDNIDSSGGDQFRLVYPEIEESQISQELKGLEGLGA
jgi:hypothetical protein